MTAPGAAPQLDVYDIAYLAGGPDRVIDTALVALVESGRVRVHAPGELAVVQPGRQHPVEAAVMDAVGTHGHRSVDTIRWRLTDDERLLGLGASLAAAGLLRRRLRFGRRGSNHAGWSATGRGRQALLRLLEGPPTDAALDGGSAFEVALRGRAAMPDERLRVEIFERPLPPAPRSAAIRRRIRDAEDRHANLMNYRNGAALGGAAAVGLGGGFDGGGFDGGGGDGGGGG